MTSEKLPEEYLQWIEDEKMIAEETYNTFKAEGRGQKAKIRFKDEELRKKVYLRPNFLRFAAAAVLILALGTTMWVKKDDIFKPKFTEEQIALSYDQTLRALAVCANSLGNEMGKIKKLNQIPESLNDIKELITLINN